MKYYSDNQRHLVCLPYSVENLHIMAESLNIKDAGMIQIIMIFQREK